ncbi:hypothetical protein PFISCL1PPCAC_2588, partial [Pristionchus fissidentatus]
VSSRGGMGGGGRGSSGGRGGSSSSHSSSSSHASSSAGSHSSPSSSHASPGRGSAGGPSSSYHPSPSISHSSFTSSLVTSLAISSLFHHSMSPYSHRYVYVVQEEKAPFRTNVTESRDYYFGVENVPIDNCTKALNETGDDTVDLIMVSSRRAQSSPETNVSLCNICTYELNENSTDMPAVEFKDGRSPSQLAWICPSDEVCCGMECCTNEAQSDLKWWMIVLISVGTAAVVLILIKCCISLRKWCATSDCQTRELPHGPAPPLDKLPREMPAFPPPPAARSYNLAAAENNNMRPASAASLSGIQPNLPKKQRRYEQQ